MGLPVPCLLCHLPGPGSRELQVPGLNQDSRLGPLRARCRCSSPQQPHLFLWLSLTFTLVCFSILGAGASSTPPGAGCSLVAVVSSARNTLNPSPLQDSRCKCHLSFPFSYFFAPISLHHLPFFPPSPPLFCSFFLPPLLIAKDRSFS